MQTPVMSWMPYEPGCVCGTQNTCSYHGAKKWLYSRNHDKPIAHILICCRRWRNLSSLMPQYAASLPTTSCQHNNTEMSLQNGANDPSANKKNKQTITAFRTTQTIQQEHKLMSWTLPPLSKHSCTWLAVQKVPGVTWSRNKQ